MGDLVERLNTPIEQIHFAERRQVVIHERAEAADEITRLRKLVPMNLQAALDMVGQKSEQYLAERRECDRLRSALAASEAREAVMREACKAMLFYTEPNRSRTPESLLFDVARARHAAESALATPNPRAEALLRIVEAARKMVRDDRFRQDIMGVKDVWLAGSTRTVTALADALRSYDEAGATSASQQPESKSKDD